MGFFNIYTKKLPIRNVTQIKYTRHENGPIRNVTDPVTEMHISVLIKITILNNQFLDRKCFTSRALLIRQSF